MVYRKEAVFFVKKMRIPNWFGVLFPLKMKLNQGHGYDCLGKELIAREFNLLFFFIAMLGTHGDFCWR